MNIIDYDILITKLKELNNLKKHQSYKTRLGYDIPYYTFGNGENHIVIVGGTHGSEIISVDFVLNLMDNLSNKKGIFKDFDDKTYTMHFIPIQNPEGFIISTSAIRTLIPKDMSKFDSEKICKKYYELYRKDDINSIENPNNKDIKLHQKMFINADYKCIDEKKHKSLRNSIKKIYEENTLPRGSIVTFRANGSGVELNRNNKYNKGIEEIKEKRIVYGPLRYNNILKSVKGPIGIPCLDVNHFEYEPENKFLLDLLSKLQKENKLCCCLLFHSTGGKIYYKPSFKAYPRNLDEENQKYIEQLNFNIALKYKEFTEYTLEDTEDENLKSFDGYLRTLFPGVILIELSKMGGNPIGPYGDILGNYIPTIQNNLKSTLNVIKILNNKSKHNK